MCPAASRIYFRACFPPLACHSHMSLPQPYNNSGAVPLRATPRRMTPRLHGILPSWTPPDRRFQHSMYAPKPYPPLRRTPLRGVEDRIKPFLRTPPSSPPITDISINKPARKLFFDVRLSSSRIVCSCAPSAPSPAASWSPESPTSCSSASESHASTSTNNIWKPLFFYRIHQCVVRFCLIATSQA